MKYILEFTETINAYNKGIREIIIYNAEIEFSSIEDLLSSYDLENNIFEAYGSTYYPDKNLPIIVKDEFGDNIYDSRFVWF